MNLTFFSTKDHIPKHNSSIVYIKSAGDSLFESFEFLFGKVEYIWDDSNGCSICYNENDSEPEISDGEYSFDLSVLIDGNDFGIWADKNKKNKTEILWAYYDDIFDEINKAVG